MSEPEGLDCGIFELKTAKGLLEKLEKDYEAVREKPTDSAAWFNFLVTAEHLPEWYCTDRSSLGRLRQNHLLKVCSHIANNAKHFRVTHKKHSSVSGTAKGNVTFGGQSESEYILYLDETEVPKLGPLMSALEFAQKLMDFWKETINNSPDVK